MAKPNFRINRKGGAEILKQMAAPHINALAEKAASAAGEGAEVETYTTDRAAAMVSVPSHQQAADGALTRALSGLGLEVRAK